MTEMVSEVEKISISAREYFEINSAVEILSATEKEIVIKLLNGFVYVTGTELKISKLIPEEKFVSLTGKILGLKFQTKRAKTSFFGRIFK
ncbi:MAG: hypothetical protein IJ538_03470 [Clostridia bacterium]|nr:hypothetical protein [Clostridia bacterium]